jgi:hypothetical protein
MNRCSQGFLGIDGDAGRAAVIRLGSSGRRPDQEVCEHRQMSEGAWHDDKSCLFT